MPAVLLAAILALAERAPDLRGDAADQAALDQRILTEARTHSESLANLTYLCDEIGPRLTGSANLKRANEWAAAKMKDYGLVNVHQETWSLPEGWERGPASARIIEPDTGRTLTVASWGWYPGTNGKVQADVVAMKATNTKELAQYKGKLKGVIVLPYAPYKLLSLEELDKQDGSPTRAYQMERREQGQAFNKERLDFIQKEGAAAIFYDAGKPFGLTFVTGSWQGKDRASAVQRMPTLTVAHNHYELLWRLANRPDPARTRVELEVQNRFVPGPMPVWNTVGEIKGSDKPDEVVVVGAHLDSWDLGQGATDNGTGSITVLETARVLAKSGVKPRRTIRFILFTGEEQGLHGSRAYVEAHKDELPRISACLVHDTGTGKVVGLGTGHRPALKPILEKELSVLKDVGLKEVGAGFGGGSDHVSFEKAGVPGMHCSQEVAGYRFTHHTQADTVDRALEASLIQGAQVMAVTALHIANLDALLPRDKPRREEPAASAKQEKPAAGRFELDHLGKLVSVGDPQISPDGKSIVVVVRRPNYDKNRNDGELVLVDVRTGNRRVLTQERTGIGQPRWSPTGDRLAFLAVAGSGKDAHHQIFVMPMNGGDAKRITNVPLGVQHYAWKPDGSEIAFASADEPANKKEIERGNDAFEVGNSDFLAKEAPTPTHVWLVTAEGTTTKRLTSGSWGLTTVPPPGQPASPLSWSPDGKSLLIVKQERPHDGDNDLTTVQVLDVATGKMRPLTDRKSLESVPCFSPDGSQVAYWYPRDGDANCIVETWVAPAAGGKGTCATAKLDRCLFHSVWMPDGKSLLVGGHDGTHVALWIQPVSGEARRLDLGRVCPTWFYQMDAHVGRDGAIALTASEPDRPTELYYLEAPDARPRRLTNFNDEVAGLSLGKVETISWETHDRFKADGVLTYPPDFAPGKKYPLVLVIHGGPQSASVERFGSLTQLLAARGYVVFEPNYRGSDHLGNAYQRAIAGDWGAGPGKDVMAGIDAVKKRGFVDESRIAVTGWSYGGYMTSWLIGNYQGWKCALAGAAVTDWMDQYNLSDGNVQGRYLFGESPWKNPEHAKLFREQSPITYARNIKTPTLILATTGDARVPITQSYALYHAIKDNGVPVKFVAYPAAGHFPGDPVRQKDLFRRWAGWLDENLK
jgi:dipeptidyl aminopeptidase/acylaminoacyl peptidase